MKKILLITTILTLSSCGHHRDVRPGYKGVHKVQLLVEQKGQGSREALEQADHFCEERYKKYASVISEKTSYVGKVDEQTYQKVKMGSSVAKTVGGTVWAMGGKKESKLGGIVGLGGQAADEAVGLGYRYIMTFACK